MFSIRYARSLVVAFFVETTVYLNKGNGVFQDVTADAGLNPAGNQAMGNRRLFLNNSAGPWLRGSVGTAENFMHIGHSLVALIVATLGGLFSLHLHAGNRERASGQSSPENRPEPTEHLSGPSR